MSRLLYAVARSQADVEAGPLGVEPVTFTGYLHGYETNAWAVYWRRNCWGPYETIDGAEKAKALLRSGYDMGTVLDKPAATDGRAERIAELAATLEAEIGKRLEVERQLEAKHTVMMRVAADNNTLEASLGEKHATLVRVADAKRALEKFEVDVARALGLCNEHEGAVECASPEKLLERIVELQRAWDARPVHQSSGESGVGELAQEWRDRAFGSQHISKLKSDTLEECAQELDERLGVDAAGVAFATHLAGEARADGQTELAERLEAKAAAWGETAWGESTTGFWLLLKTKPEIVVVGLSNDGKCEPMPEELASAPWLVRAVLKRRGMVAELSFLQVVGPADRGDELHPGIAQVCGHGFTKEVDQHGTPVCDRCPLPEDERHG